MKVYFDERSAAPSGWIAASRPQQAIAYMQTGNVEVINLQTDQSTDRFGTTMDIMEWVKRAILNYGLIPPRFKFHGDNEINRERLEIEVLKINSLYRVRGQGARRFVE
ncbi:MAG: hypothetical protein HWE13_01045 [Gammaproteobacteria bacterium]|nr:hypothetical protein [Gammaproteobacteria bacterium]NVK86675.1 hypothetical protein [Gammaproteobacteria bacterium]